MSYHTLLTQNHLMREGERNHIKKDRCTKRLRRILYCARTVQETMYVRQCFCWRQSSHARFCRFQLEVPGIVQRTRSTCVSSQAPDSCFRITVNVWQSASV